MARVNVWLKILKVADGRLPPVGTAAETPATAPAIGLAEMVLSNDDRESEKLATLPGPAPVKGDPLLQPPLEEPPVLPDDEHPPEPPELPEPLELPPLLPEPPLEELLE